MQDTYKIHNFIPSEVCDAVLKEGILYKLDETGKTALLDIPWWDGRVMGHVF